MEKELISLSLFWWRETGPSSRVDQRRPAEFWGGMTVEELIKQTLELDARATKGPFVAVELNEACPLPAGVAIAVHKKSEPYKKSGCICEITGQGESGYSPEVTHANASLIANYRASAPILAHCLKEALTWIQLMGQPMDRVISPPKLREKALTEISRIVSNSVRGDGE